MIEGRFLRWPRHTHLRLGIAAPCRIRLENPILINDATGCLLGDKVAVEIPFGIGKSNTLECQPLDKLPRRWIAFQTQHLSQPRSDDLRVIGIDPRRRNQVHRFLAGIDIKLSRLGQTLAHIFNPIAVAGLHPEHTGLRTVHNMSRFHRSTRSEDETPPTCWRQ